MRFPAYATHLQPARILVQLTAALGITLMAMPSHACSCQFDPEQGFIHARDKGESVLPANAKGVLFVVPTPGYVASEDNLYIFSNQPRTSLKPEDFVVTDSANNKPLKTVIEKVTMKRADPKPPDHYFVFKNSLDVVCYHGGTNARCPRINERNGNRPTIAELQKQEKLNEITKAINSNTGVFRISPQGGFQEGKTYTIVSSATDISGTRIGSPRITVRIAAELKTSATDRYLLEAQGLPHAQVISIPMGGSCSANRPAIVQDLSYGLPPNYVPYRESMMFFTERLEDAIRPGATARKFAVHMSVGSNCSQIRLGGSEIGIGKERVTSSCTPGEISPPAQMRGLVGFLEMDDELHLTPTVAIDFRRRQGSSCDTFGFLKESIATNNAEEIRQHLCGLPNGSMFDGKVSPAEFMPVLTRLSATTDVEMQACAGSAMLGMTLRSEVFAASSIKEVVAKIGPIIRKVEGQSKSRMMSQLSDLIGNVSRQPDRDITPALFTPLVPELARILAAPDDPFLIKGYATNALFAMGVSAKEAVPVLLDALTHGRHDRIPALLLTIAPKDPRVLAVIRSLAEEAMLHMAEGNYARENIVLVYAHMLQETDKPAAVAMVTKVAKQNSADAIGLLGEMGSAAQPAVPTLLDIARTSKLMYMRTSAMEALVKIGSADVDLLKIIAQNLKIRLPRSKEYVEDMSALRERSISILGDMRSRGLPLQPSLLAVLDTDPTPDEFRSMIYALQSIGAPKKAIRQAIERAEKSGSPDIRKEAAAFRRDLDWDTPGN